MNPWLDIPETDYVAHMSSREVDQYRVLNQLLRDVLATVRPGTALVLGCSTGNGLEHIDPAVTSRVVAVDINPRYLRKLVERFPQLRPVVLDSDGNLRQVHRLYLNGELLDRGDAGRALAPNDELGILTAIAGG